jgi:hypothetical protein
VFLYIINILSYNYFIKFYLKDKIILYNILIFIKTKLKKTRFAIIISNKYLNIISIITRIGVLKLVPKAYLKHALRSRNYISFVGVFIRSSTPYLLFLLARQYTLILNNSYYILPLPCYSYKPGLRLNYT